MRGVVPLPVESGVFGRRERLETDRLFFSFFFKLNVTTFLRLMITYTVGCESPRRPCHESARTFPDAPWRGSPDAHSFVRSFVFYSTFCRVFCIEIERGEKLRYHFIHFLSRGTSTHAHHHTFFALNFRRDPREIPYVLFYWLLRRVR